MNAKQLQYLEDFKADVEWWEKHKHLSEDELLHIINVIIDDMESYITVVDSASFRKDITIQFEIVAYLSNRPDLLGILVSLSYAFQLGLKFRNQLEIAEYIGYTQPTFIRKKQELVKLGIIDLIKNGRKTIFQFNSVKRVNVDTPISVLDAYKLSNKLRQKLVPMNNEWRKKQKELEQAQAQQEFLKLQIDTKAKNIVKKKTEAKKRDEQRFPNEDYEIVLKAFIRLKGVGLLGPEITRAKRAIKQMFLASRKPKEIIDCMKFFRDNQHRDEYKWLSSWTLETVMKKMPEFVAGKLKAEEMGDDLPDL
jgi:hypothetical protein